MRRRTAAKMAPCTTRHVGSVGHRERLVSWSSGTTRRIHATSTASGHSLASERPTTAAKIAVRWVRHSHDHPGTSARLAYQPQLADRRTAQPRLVPRDGYAWLPASRRPERLHVPLAAEPCLQHLV